jgi:hypothetical protein
MLGDLNERANGIDGRGLHSSTFRLNVSTFWRICKVVSVFR